MMDQALVVSWCPLCFYYYRLLPSGILHIRKITQGKQSMERNEIGYSWRLYSYELGRSSNDSSQIVTRCTYWRGLSFFSEIFSMLWCISFFLMLILSLFTFNETLPSLFMRFQAISPLEDVLSSQIALVGTTLRQLWQSFSERIFPLIYEAFH